MSDGLIIACGLGVVVGFVLGLVVYARWLAHQREEILEEEELMPLTLFGRKK